MARKKSAPPPYREENGELRVSRDDAVTRINVQIEKGNELATRAIQTEQQYSQFSGDIQSWSDRNEQLLGVLFTNSALKTRYRRSAHGVIVMSMDEPFLYKQ